MTTYSMLPNINPQIDILNAGVPMYLSKSLEPKRLLASRTTKALSHRTEVSLSCILYKLKLYNVLSEAKMKA